MDFAEGVYFNLPEEDYFSVRALSSSGMKHLRISPLDFWARAKWLNPNHEEDNDGEEPEARTLGKAYDKRIVEGKDAFARCYAPAPNPADYPGVLTTAKDIQAAIRRYNETAETKLKIGGDKEEIIERFLTACPTAKIWDVIEESYRAEHEGKTFLSQRWLDKIELAAAMVEKHPHLSKAFTGGAPQISIFWTCPVIGVNCKARLDYLKPRAIVDLKTTANFMGRPIKDAVAREFAARRYFIQGAFYYEAAKQVSRLIKAGLSDREAPAHDKTGLLTALAADYDKTVLFVFQLKGVAPVAIGRTFSDKSLTFQIAQAEIENLKQVYRTYSEKYGSDPWVDPSTIETFSDEDMPPWAMQ